MEDYTIEVRTHCTATDVQRLGDAIAAFVEKCGKNLPDASVVTCDAGGSEWPAFQPQEVKPTSDPDRRLEVDVFVEGSAIGRINGDEKLDLAGLTVSAYHTDEGLVVDVFGGDDECLASGYEFFHVTDTEVQHAQSTLSTHVQSVELASGESMEIRRLAGGPLIGLDASYLEQLDDASHPNNPYGAGVIHVPLDEVVQAGAGEVPEETRTYLSKLESLGQEVLSDIVMDSRLIEIDTLKGEHEISVGDDGTWVRAWVLVKHDRLTAATVWPADCNPDDHAGAGGSDEIVVLAECHSDDRVRQVRFCAVPWLRECTQGEIDELLKEDWCGCEVSDSIALTQEDSNPELASLFLYGRTLAESGAEIHGFEVTIDESIAMAWLRANRPDISLPDKETY